MKIVLFEGYNKKVLNIFHQNYDNEGIGVLDMGDSI